MALRGAWVITSTWFDRLLRYEAREAWRFRVWAPFVPQVTLCLHRDGRRIPLDPEPRGYHVAVVEGIESGDRYLFDIGNDRR